MRAPGVKGLSVYRIDKLIPREIWELGKYFVAFKRKPISLKGRGDLRAENIKHIEMDIKSSFLLPHPRHADIVGWPDNAVLEGQIALRLADLSSPLITVPQDFQL